MLIKNLRAVNKIPVQKSTKNKTYNNNIVQELIHLTKQNQHLKIQLASLEEQILKICMTKNKYKKKYKQLKQQVQHTKATKKTILNQPQKQQQHRMHNNYHRPADFSPISQKNSWYFEGPNSGLDFNRVPPSSNYHNWKNHQLQFEQDTNARYERNIIISELQKINYGLEDIHCYLKRNHPANDRKQTDEKLKYLEKFPLIEKLLHLLNDNLHQIKQLLCQKNASHEQYKSRQFYTRDKSQSQRGKYRYKEKNQQIRISTSINQKDQPSACEQTNYPTPNHCPLKSRTHRKNLVQQNNIINYHISLGLNPNDPSRKNDNRALSNERKLSRNSKSQLESPCSISSERQKWQEFHEIGKQLKNWKFANYSDCSSLSKQQMQLQTN